MGVNDAERSRKEDRKNARNESKQKRYGSSQPKGEADWSAVNSQLIASAITAITRSGGALQFGYTRDGGAFALRIYDNGDVYPIYLPHVDDIEGVLHEIIEDNQK
jgi:hypothetical protein